MVGVARRATHTARSMQEIRYDEYDLHNNRGGYILITILRSDSMVMQDDTTRV
jgi:hypothetical protein